MKLHIVYNYKDRFPGLKGSDLTDELIRMLLRDKDGGPLNIIRTERGKPYDKDRRIFFSVSHTHDVFGLAEADFEIGMDLQKKGSRNLKKIAERFFVDEEISALENLPQSSYEREFMRIWTRKEALVKYRGAGLKDVLGREQVLDREDVRFIDFELEQGITGALCIPAGEKDDKISISYGE